MCGRFVSTSAPDAVATYFGAETDLESLGQNFNVAPTQDIYGVVADPGGQRSVQAFHWGLIPSWAKDRKIASRMINARSESLAEKNAFKGLYAKKRCLIPMDGFYEWIPGSPDGPLNAKGKPLKQPLFIHRADGRPLAVAGLWTRWKDPEDPEGRWLHSATVVTTAANPTMAAVHEELGRTCVPFILPPDSPNLRMLQAVGTEAQKRKYMQPYIEGRMVSAIAISEPGAGGDPAHMRACPNVAGSPTTARCSTRSKPTSPTDGTSPPRQQPPGWARPRRASGSPSRPISVPPISID